MIDTTGLSAKLAKVSHSLPDGEAKDAISEALCEVGSISLAIHGIFSRMALIDSLTAHMEFYVVETTVPDDYDFGTHVAHKTNNNGTRSLYFRDRQEAMSQHSYYIGRTGWDSIFGQDPISFQQLVEEVSRCS